MDKLVIKGGKRLSGDVRISGAKNSVLPLLASALLAPGCSTFSNVPSLRDVVTMGLLLGNMGARVDRDLDSMVVDTSELSGCEAPYSLVRTMRAAVLVLGPLLARMGRARVSLPGGCAIGARPVNLHLKGLEKMGARIEIDEGYIVASASRLRGAHIHLDIPTVTGTENLMMAAVLADGETVIENAAREPEVTDLAEALTGMGASVQGAGSSRISVRGVSALSPVTYRAIPDRIETGTFMVAAAITQGDVRILGACPEHVEAVSDKLRETGAEVILDQNILQVRMHDRPRAVDITTMPYPGFPTDMQAQLMALLCTAEGTSVITENIFENRYMHVAELDRFGADVRVDGAIAQVRGLPRLTGAPVMATDLRASASLVLAGLVAEGTTTVRRIYHLDRGYERIEHKLAALGADIAREKDD